MDEPEVQHWPKVRISPTLNKRLLAAIERAKSRMGISEAVNALLDECLAQIEHEGDDIPPAPTVIFLRIRAGNGTSTPRSMIPEIEEILSRLEALEARLKP